jgi:hypothetical protein
MSCLEPRRKTMQAIQFLKMAHGVTQAAFQEIEAAPEARRGILWDRLRPELEAHEKMEEDHLYEPVAREVGSDRALAYWEKAHHREGEAAERLIDRIDRLGPSDPMWLATVKQLKHTLEQHIRREEQEIWPRIERVWDARRLEEAGRQMAAMQMAAMTEHATVGAR